MPYERATFQPVQQWLVFLRAMEVRYGREAAARGESFTPLTDDECLVAARLVAQLGLRPADVVGPVLAAR